MAGSYDPARTTLDGVTGELARLEAQAALSFEEELRVYRAVGLTATGPLLEVGCGSGAVTRRLRAARPGLRVVPLDADPVLLRHAAAGGVAGDATRLPIRSGCAAGALVRYVLQHVARPLDLLTEVRRVLRPGGVLVVVDVDGALWGVAEPLFRDLDRIHDRMVGAQRTAGGDRLIGRRLTRLLRAAGYTDVHLHPFAVTSDDHPLDEFEPLLGPGRLAPLLDSGAVTLTEFGRVAAGWQRFRRDPAAWVMLLGLAAVGYAQV
jgi:SAM-dependent methyltransferase